MNCLMIDNKNIFANFAKAFFRHQYQLVKVATQTIVINVFNNLQLRHVRNVGVNLCGHCIIVDKLRIV